MVVLAFLTMRLGTLVHNTIYDGGHGAHPYTILSDRPSMLLVVTAVFYREIRDTEIQPLYQQVNYLKKRDIRHRSHIIAVS